jgi:nucleotide sugar dehydrogenase
MKIGICGTGFVGNAIYQFLTKHKVLYDDIFTYDKYKKLNTFDVLLKCDICFICLPTNYNSILKTYDMTELNETLAMLSEKKYRGIILIKSTILPDYCSDHKYSNLIIIHNPEFLSARTAVEDFSNQTHIILGYTTRSKSNIHIICEFYKELFPNAIISICRSEESALTKLACNSFYATKVQYFTELFLLCETLKISYNDVKEMMLKNQWIHPQHTNVPGPDGSISFGGACLPKDIMALNELMKRVDTPNQVMNSVIIERNQMRND